MNLKIKKYFEEIELLLLSSGIVYSYEIIRQDISDNDGKIRIRLQLSNLDLVDMFEYIVVEENKLIVKKYHHHWQSKENELIARWDNAPHHKELENFPHHLHKTNVLEPMSKIPNVKYILRTIGRHFKNEL